MISYCSSHHSTVINHFKAVHWVSRVILSTLKSYKNFENLTSVFETFPTVRKLEMTKN